MTEEIEETIEKIEAIANRIENTKILDICQELRKLLENE